jgi:hypothetical protein
MSTEKTPLHTWHQGIVAGIRPLVSGDSQSIVTLLSDADNNKHPYNSSNMLRPFCACELQMIYALLSSHVQSWYVLHHQFNDSCMVHLFSVLACLSATVHFMTPICILHWPRLPLVQAPVILAQECEQFLRPFPANAFYAVRRRRMLAGKIFAVVVVSQFASRTFTRNIAESFVVLRASKLGIARSKPGKPRTNDSDRSASMSDAVNCQLSLASAKMSSEKLFCAI